VEAPGSGRVIGIESDNGRYRITLIEERHYYLEGGQRHGEWELLIDGLSSVSAEIGAVSAGTILGRAGATVTAVARSPILDPWLLRHTSRIRYLDGYWWYAAEWMSEQAFDALSYRQADSFLDEAEAAIAGQIPLVPGRESSRVSVSSEPIRVTIVLPSLPTAASELLPGVEASVSVGMIDGYELLLGFGKALADRLTEQHVPGAPVLMYCEPALILHDSKTLLIRVDGVGLVPDEQIIEERIDQVRTGP
jgi:hypothetical protein